MGIHRQVKDVLGAVEIGPVLLVGRPGTGKTTIARQVAVAKQREFLYTGPVQSEYKLLGFRDANGIYRDTPFYRAYTKGALFLFDEIDASSPQALVAFNAALDNNIADFPVGTEITLKSPGFLCVATANTFGRGGSELRYYTARQALDATTLDRFIVITIDYDRDLEASLAYDQEWCTTMQSYRRAAESIFQKEPERAPHFISMRAIVSGSKLAFVLKRSKGYHQLSAQAREWELRKIEDMVVWRGVEARTVERIRAEALRLGKSDQGSLL